MATKSHKTLTGNQLHEPKGADAATDDYVMTVTSNAAVWKKLTADNLTGTGNSFGGQLYHVQERKSSGTAATNYGSGWNTRAFTTEITTEISGASLASNQVTLPAGTYFAIARGQAYQLNSQRLRIRNVTDGTTLVDGVNQYDNSAAYSGGVAQVMGRFTLASSKVISVQHYASAGSGKGGLPASTGENEVYGELLIWKIA